jgi:hypothetical protein
MMKLHMRVSVFSFPVLVDQACQCVPDKIEHRVS